MTIRTSLISSASALAVLAVAVPVVADAATTAPMANAAAAKPTVKSANNKQVKRTIVVNAKGLTLYRLAPETSKHILCKSSACLAAWPPLTIAKGQKPVKGPGVTGKLGTIKRGNKLQVTDNGWPLYTFSGDSKAGQANGEGLMNFGGTWHTVAAKTAGAKSQSAPATPAPMPTMPSAPGSDW